MPSSAAVSPFDMPAARNTAVCEAIRMSQARLKQNPPPIAGPLIAAMTGWCILRRARITSSKSSIERNAIDVFVRPVMFGTDPGSSRSAPEQNPDPLR